MKKRKGSKESYSLQMTMEHLAHKLGVRGLDELVGRIFTFSAPKNLAAEGNKQPFAFMGRIKSCYVEDRDLFLFIDHGQFACEGFLVEVEGIRLSEGAWTCTGKMPDGAPRRTAEVVGELRLRKVITR